MPTQDRLAAILLAAPTWARLGLTVPTAHHRERAADAMAALILQRLEQPEPPTSDPAQMVLPIA